MSDNHFTEEWLQSYYARIHGQKTAAQEAPASKEPEKQNKYRNRKVTSGGLKFDSVHESKVYEELRLRCLAGEYICLGTQVPFFLPGGIKYIADFLVIRPSGEWIVMDAKSDATRKDKVYRLKRRLMKECLHIEIQEV